SCRRTNAVASTRASMACAPTATSTSSSTRRWRTTSTGTTDEADALDPRPEVHLHILRRDRRRGDLAPLRLEAARGTERGRKRNSRRTGPSPPSGLAVRTATASSPPRQRHTAHPSGEDRESRIQRLSNAHTPVTRPINQKPQQHQEHAMDTTIVE